MFIEAENLEALKILQKSYAGSVKMIYIDPPYNTGSDSFIYPDKFSESREEYARRVGDTDDAGYLKRDGVFQGAWRKNGKDSGHYHSNWLSMMLPRLHLAKTLLREDGVIFISIDDNEQAQLKLLCDEVFGAENFVAEFLWKKKSTTSNVTGAEVSAQADYQLCYKKSQSAKLKQRTKSKETRIHPYVDEIGRYRTAVIEKKDSGGYKRDSMKFPILGHLPREGKRWQIGEKTAKDLEQKNRFYFDGEKILLKIYDFEEENTFSANPNILDEVGTSDSASKLVNEQLFNIPELFSNPKPIGLVKFFAHISTDTNEDLILDFFSGSGTTAHAVMQLNAEDGGSRRFICVQLPEETDEKSEARKAGFNTIAEIAKERIRRAGRQISDGLQDGSEIDTGFKVFKLAESGFKQWRQPGQADTEALQRELSLNIDSVLSEKSSENLLYELMLRMGLKLTCKVSFSDDVYFVEDEDTGGLYAFLLERVNQDLIDAVLTKHPVKVAVLDRLFEGDDALKSNTVLQMKDAGVMFDCV